MASAQAQLPEGGGEAVTPSPLPRPPPCSVRGYEGGDSHGCVLQLGAGGNGRRALPWARCAGGWRVPPAARGKDAGGCCVCDQELFYIFFFCFNPLFFRAGVPYPARRPPCNDCVAPSSSTPTAVPFGTTFRWVYMSRSEVMARGVSWRSTREGGGGIYISRQEKVVLADLL